MPLKEYETIGDLFALGYIVALIRGYRYETHKHQMLSRNQTVDIYLKQHLSDDEWALWQRLSEPERAALRIPPIAEA